ncbi:MAG: hypothetical protein R2867_18430 [Caldilineaceae bacterium]
MRRRPIPYALGVVPPHLVPGGCTGARHAAMGLEATIMFVPPHAMPLRGCVYPIPVGHEVRRRPIPYALGVVPRISCPVGARAGTPCGDGIGRDHHVCSAAHRAPARVRLPIP